jgi:16S rRNA (guanine966-N2)-methyltransferase
MHIGAGWAKGQKLQTPKGKDTRPTSDKVRSAIFDSLQQVIQGAEVLDLFSGTGALGLEALSRGAKRCVFVESEQAPYKSLKKNIAELIRRAAAQDWEAPTIETLNRDAYKAVQSLSGYKFDLVLIDPPYADVAVWMERSLVDLDKLLAPDGCLVLESAANLDLQALIQPGIPWEIFREKCYGDTKVTLWRR